MMSGIQIDKDHSFFQTSFVDSICIVYGSAGSGKSILLTEFALSRLAHQQKVLHFSTGDQRKLRQRYSRANDIIPRQNRLLHTKHGSPFSAAEIETICAQYADFLDFVPDLIIVENVDVDNSWQVLANRYGCVLLGSASSPEPSFSCSTIQLVEMGDNIAIHSDQPIPSLYIDPTTQRIYESQPVEKGERQTLYTTGAAGAETLFGELAEQWGIHEVHYRFTGHIQSRSNGSVCLTEEELHKGTVSLHYVSRKLRRSWNKTPLLKKVLQLIWHVVHKADQIFIIGSIQEDNTVHGGTGWSVELAQRWNKPVWVFDQEKTQWFVWQESQWVSCGTPKITAKHFAGSGTRFLQSAGKKAIEELYHHSFAT